MRHQLSRPLILGRITLQIILEQCGFHGSSLSDLICHIRTQTSRIVVLRRFQDWSALTSVVCMVPPSRSRNETATQSCSRYWSNVFPPKSI